jgi:hypothetical protein
MGGWGDRGGEPSPHCRDAEWRRWGLGAAFWRYTIPNEDSRLFNPCELPLNTVLCILLLNFLLSDV